MWRIVNGPERVDFRQKAAAHMRDAEAFEASMRRALKEWPVSCEVALSATIMNRIAWLGHAGCCLATGAPEDVTREAWWTLNSLEQDAGNAAAQRVLDAWEERYADAKVIP